METQSKAQRDAVVPDASGSGSGTGETETRSARDPSPPVLSPVGFRATPVLVDKSQDDAGQHQEHADLRHGPEISTLVMICLDAALTAELLMSYFLISYLIVRDMSMYCSQMETTTSCAEARPHPNYHSNVVRHQTLSLSIMFLMPIHNKRNVNFYRYMLKTLT